MAELKANDDIEAALRYHEVTKHSEESLARDPHFLDWSNRPQPFKLYRDLESVSLPGDAFTLVDSAPTALDSIAMSRADISETATGEDIPNLAKLARVLFLAAGITKRKGYPGGEIYFRSYANTGGLYHIDLYLITGDLPDLPAGVYHFGPHDFSLSKLRDGDYRSVMIEASGHHMRVTQAPVILVSTSTYWRNSWKYRARTYRHCFWDAGTLHANLIAAAHVEALRPMVVLGFADSMVTELLGLDPDREAALTLVTLGQSSAKPSPAPPLSKLALETLPLSRFEIEYPLLREIHSACSLHSGASAGAWRGGMTEPHREVSGGALQRLKPWPAAELPTVSLADVIRKRGSTRAFDRDRAISFEAFSTVLDRATRCIPADVLDPADATLLELYVIVNAVAGLPSGTYYYRRQEGSLELLREGNFRGIAGRLGLDQELPAAAAVNIYSLCSLPDVLGRFGNRGYRAAQLEGGIIAGRMYLSAYAQGFGASGLTFYDDEVTDFFSPHAAGKSVMFLIALGYPDRVALGLEPPVQS